MVVNKMAISEDDKRRIEERVSLVKQLRDKGFSTAESISNELKLMKKENLEISPTTISRDLQRIREKGRDYVEDIILSGEFIVQFHEGLLELDRIKIRCSNNVAKAEREHQTREGEINEITTGAEGLPTEADVMRLKLQNDTLYHSVSQNNEKIVMQATKEFYTLFTKNEVVWALKKWIKENNPKAFDKPELQEIFNKLGENPAEEKSEN